MMPLSHVFFGALLGICLLIFSKAKFLEALVAFLSSFLIDVDHYFAYIYKTGSWNLLKAVRYYHDATDKVYHKGYRCPLFIFHSIEFFILISLLTFVHKIFFFVLIGILLHFALDWYVLLKNRTPYAKDFCAMHFLLSKKNHKYI